MRAWVGKKEKKSHPRWRRSHPSYAKSHPIHHPVCHPDHPIRGWDWLLRCWFCLIRFEQSEQSCVCQIWNKHAFLIWLATALILAISFSTDWFIRFIKHDRKHLHSGQLLIFRKQLPVIIYDSGENSCITFSNIDKFIVYVYNNKHYYGGGWNEKSCI